MVDYKTVLNSQDFLLNSSLYDDLGIPFVNRFVALIPSFPTGVNYPFNTPFHFQVMSVDCPGLTITNGEMELNGANRYYFKTRSYDDVMISFYESSDLKLRTFFYEWMYFAVGIDNVNGGVNRKYLNTVIAPDLIVAPLDAKGKAHKGDHFRNIFPTKIQDINYNYASANEIVKTTVTFKYMFHDIEYITT